jgi:type II secretory ATPase GspE/PulE/Tfp pilus assembly ATPase PilB-like protein
VKLYEAIGCNHCRQSGYIGRVSIIELFQADEVIKDMIEHNTSAIEMQRYINTALSSNMKEDALQKILKGITSLQEVLRIVN